MIAPVPPASEPRKQRSDGAEARMHLLRAAMKLFADRGFAKTSTREIALAAGANIASISYYFGDKAGLYRAVFREPMGACEHTSAYLSAELPLRDALRGLVKSFLDPLKQADFAQQMIRLHFREMLEPTGLWAEQIDQHIRPTHAWLVAVLGRHLKVDAEDDDLHRLAFSIAGLGMHIFITREVTDSVRPELLATPEAIDLWGEQLVDQAEAMVAVAVEHTRRQKGLTR